MAYFHPVFAGAAYGVWHSSRKRDSRNAIYDITIHMHSQAGSRQSICAGWEDGVLYVYNIHYMLDCLESRHA